MKKALFEDKVLGCIYGTAFGDALGAPVERMSHQEIIKFYGGPVTSVKTKWYKADWDPVDRLNRMRGYGIITDDTLMTLSLMRVYEAERRHLDAFDLAKEFVKEIAFRPRYIPEFDREAMILERLFYPEKHIFNRHTLANCDPRDGGQGNMVNCGAAMYISPIGVVNACNPKAAYDEAIDFACGQQLSYGLEAAGVLAACVAKAFEPGADEQSIVTAALSVAKDGTKAAIEKMTEAALALRPIKDDKQAIINKFFDVMLTYSPVGEQYVRHIDRVGLPTNNYTPSRLYAIEELPIALAYLLLHAGEPMDAIVDGVNSGRDTDSIGVMTGCIAGTLYGSAIFDEEEIHTIDEKSRLALDDSALRFARVAQDIVKKDMHEASRLLELLGNID